MGVKFHVTGDTSYVIPNLVRRSPQWFDDLDVDYDNIQYTNVRVEHITVDDFITSSWFGQSRHYYDPEDEEYSGISWAEAPDHLHDDIVEEYKSDLSGRLFLVQADILRDEKDGTITISILVDDGGLGAVEVLEIWLGGYKRDIGQ